MTITVMGFSGMGSLWWRDGCDVDDDHDVDGGDVDDDDDVDGGDVDDDDVQVNEEQSVKREELLQKQIKVRKLLSSWLSSC